jgi:hypothetical protein
MKDQSFEFLEVSVANSEIHAKSIPRRAVVIVQMLIQTPFKIAGEPNVVKLIPPVEGVDPLAMAHVSLEEVLIFFNRVAADSFDVLAYQRCLSRHGFSTPQF